MATKYYNVFLENDKGNLGNCYKKFAKEYLNNTREMGTCYIIFDINNIATVLNIKTEKEMKSQTENNITFIGTSGLINKTIQEIKSKGFSLERKIN